METIKKEEVIIFEGSTCNLFLCFDGDYYFMKRKDHSGKEETSTPFLNAVFLIDSWQEGTLEFSE